MHRRKLNNYNLFEGFSRYVADGTGIFILLLLFMAGALLGNVVSAIMIAVMGEAFSMDCATAVAYPIQFIPPMFYALYKSHRNEMFENGIALDSRHFGSAGWFAVALLCIIVTLAAGFVADPINSMLPPMPEWLEKAMESLTEGNIWLNFLCVSIFAPLFEEWLCRGQILRGLLNYKHKDKQGNEKEGIAPWKAIVISALIFGLIHLNPWQAIPAFILGCLFGYVYYKTGSLWLTMLMHFTNNTFSLVMSNIDSLKDVDNFSDILSTPAYIALVLASAVVVALVCSVLKKIPLQRHQGNCDEISASLDI